jgi:hypothetical protein
MKKFNEFINESIESTNSQQEDMMNDEENIWFVTDNGRPVSGWSYLSDAITDGILSDNQETGDEWDMTEDIDSHLSNHGYGEDYEEMEEYDQDILDIFVSSLIEKYAPSSTNLRIIKHPQTNN